VGLWRHQAEKGHEHRRSAGPPQTDYEKAHFEARLVHRWFERSSQDDSGIHDFRVEIDEPARSRGESKSDFVSGFSQSADAGIRGID
jgi:hypothetical protein